MGKLTEYPGSPLISASLLREQDRLQCSELHSTDFELLQRRFADDKRVRVEKLDAWQGIQGHAAAPASPWIGADRSFL